MMKLKLFYAAMGCVLNLYAADCSDEAIERNLQLLNPNLNISDPDTRAAVKSLKETAVLIRSDLDLPPFHAQLEEYFECNGVLLDPWHVLTNAHCLIGSSKSTVHFLNETSIEVAGVSAWGKTQDTILLKLNEKAPYQPYTAKPLRENTIATVGEKFILWPSCKTDLKTSHIVGSVQKWGTVFDGPNTIVLHTDQTQTFETLSGSRVLDSNLQTSGLMTSTVTSLKIDRTLNGTSRYLRPIFLRRYSSFDLKPTDPSRVESLALWNDGLKNSLFGAYMQTRKWEAFEDTRDGIANHLGQKYFAHCSPRNATIDKISCPGVYALLANFYIEYFQRSFDLEGIESGLGFASNYVDLFRPNVDSQIYEIIGNLLLLKQEEERIHDLRSTQGITIPAGLPTTACESFRIASSKDPRNLAIKETLQNICNK